MYVDELIEHILKISIIIFLTIASYRLLFG